MLSLMTEALRQQPERYNMIFDGNNNTNDYTNNERQNAMLAVAQTLANSLIERLVNQTMETLESNTEPGAKAEDTKSTEVVAKAEVKDTEAAAAEEETKPEEEANKAGIDALACHCLFDI